MRAELDTGQYPTGVKVDDKEIAALPITRHRFHGDWNYTLQPTNSLWFPRNRGGFLYAASRLRAAVS